MIQWHYGEHGQQFGPVSDAELRSLISSGRVSAQTVVWRDGMSGWRPLGEVPELLPGADVVGAQAVPHFIAPNTSLAITSLELGLIALFLSWTWVGALAGIPAVIFGHMAISQIRKAPLQVGGHGRAVAGLVFGYLGIVILLVMSGFFVFATLSKVGMSHGYP
jgi:hypothetical protein